MNHLKGLDTVAYIRFASVYRDFKDVREFKEELEGLLDATSRDQEQGSGIREGRMNDSTSWHPEAGSKEYGRHENAQSHSDSRRRHRT